MSANATPPPFSRRTGANQLGLSVTTVDRLIASGEIRAVRIGRRVLIPASEIDRLLGVGAAR